VKYAREQPVTKMQIPTPVSLYDLLPSSPPFPHL